SVTTTPESYSPSLVSSATSLKGTTRKAAADQPSCGHVTPSSGRSSDAPKNSAPPNCGSWLTTTTPTTRNSKGAHSLVAQHLRRSGLANTCSTSSVSGRHRECSGLLLLIRTTEGGNGRTFGRPP